MTSTGLSDKRVNTFSAIFKDTFKRNLPGYIILNIISALYVFAVSLITMEFNLRGVKIDYDFFYDITYGYTVCFVLGIALITAAVGFVLAIRQFREIFSRQSSDFYFSMPVKRSTYINANMLYGALCIFSAFFTALVFGIIFTKTPLIFAIEHYGIKLPFLFQSALNAFCSVMVCYALFMLCVAASGKIWHVLLFSAAAVISSFVAAVGAAAYLNRIYGFSANTVYVSAVSPVGNIAASVASKGYLKYAFLLISIAEFAVVFALCHKVFKNRGAETAENIPIGKFVPVLTIVFWQAAAFAMGTVFDIHIVLCALIGIAFSFISTVLFSALIYKKIFNKQTLISFISVSALGLVFSAAVAFVPQAAGYTEYIPEQNEIKYVSVEGFDNYWYNNYKGGLEDYIYEFTDLFDALESEDDSYYSTVYSLKTEESVSKLIDLHKKMFEKDVMNRELEERYDDYFSDEYEIINIEYHLKNGRNVKRRYVVISKAVSNEVAALLQTDEALDYQEPFNMDKSNILFAEFSKYDDSTEYFYEDYDVTSPDYYNGTYLMPDDYSELFSAMRKDRMAEPTDVFIYNSNLPVSYSYDYSADSHFDIYLYSANEYTTDEDREFFASHSPQEILAYGYRISEKENREFPYDEVIVSLDFKYDKNTVKYLKSIGIDID